MGDTDRPVRTDTLTRGGTEIVFDVHDGPEPAVVLLHGLAGSSREFRPTVAALPDHRVVTIDQRGHGRSTRRPADTSRAAFVADVVAVIEAVTTEPVVLAGQSMGGHTAMLVAAARPDLVRAIVLLEVDQGGGDPDDHAAMADWFRSWPVPFADEEAARAHLGDGPLERAWVADLERTDDGLRPRFDADVMHDTIRAVATPRWAEWRSVTAPTLLLYADGGMFTAAQQDAFADAGQRVHRVALTDASHDAHLDAFDQWIHALRAFLGTT